MVFIILCNSLIPVKTIYIWLERCENELDRIGQSEKPKKNLGLDLKIPAQILSSRLFSPTR
jgi:hypothetical protein